MGERVEKRRNERQEEKNAEWREKGKFIGFLENAKADIMSHKKDLNTAVQDVKKELKGLQFAFETAAIWPEDKLKNVINLMLREAEGEDGIKFDIQTAIDAAWEGPDANAVDAMIEEMARKYE